MKRSAALLLVAALVAGGCGSGGLLEAVVSPASTVAEIPMIVVPDFVGQTSEYARGVLDVLGLTVYIEESADVSGEPDVVARQLPAAGTAVTSGSLVMVTVPAPQIRKPTLGLSAAAEQLLSETENLKAGHAATIRAARVLEQDPDITHNPFAVIIKFEDGQTDEEITASLTAIGGTRVGKPLGFDNLFLVETLADPAEAVISLRSETAVEEAGLDYVVHTTDITNDPEVGKQWGLVQTPGLDMSNAWAIATGTAEVVVAVIDSGIQLDHPDLAPNIWVNPGEIANNNVDDDNNGFIDDVHGWDFWNWDNDPDDDDEDGHGTHVAGTIGAVINNGVGVSGIAPNVRLMALKVFNAHGDAYSNDIYSALEYAVTNGAQISNNSYGGYGENPKMGALIDAAARVGHVFVAGAGNDENNNDISPAFPASYPNDSIISVAASDQSGDLASFQQGGSNYGRTSVDVAAPGRDILSTISNSGYGWMSGTSMAAPHVTGLVALMRSIEPNLTPSAIREILIETSHFDSRLQNLVGSNGTVDAAAAVRAITQGLVPTTTTTPPAPTTQAPTTTSPPTTTIPPTDNIESGDWVAFSSDHFDWKHDIYVMRPDGSDLRRLTNNDIRDPDPVRDSDPVWSPDRRHIAFTSNRDDPTGYSDIFVMDVDGQEVRRLTDNYSSVLNNSWNIAPSWSPDGRRIAFIGGRSVMTGDKAVLVMDTNGENIQKIVESDCWKLESPVWSPDGTQIAFKEHCYYTSRMKHIWLVNPDGSGLRKIHSWEGGLSDTGLDWAPDGNSLVFSKTSGGSYDFEVSTTHAAEIYTMDADGTNVRQLTFTASCGKNFCPGNFDPAWSPDGEYIVYTNDATGFWELHRMDADGSNVVPTGQRGSEAAFAPAASSGSSPPPTTTATPAGEDEAPAPTVPVGLNEEAILTATYEWGPSDPALILQELLGVTADGWYGNGTRAAHAAELAARGLSTDGVPAPPTTAAPPATTTTAPVPTTTRVTPTTTPVPTTTGDYTHPSRLQTPGVAPPYSNGEGYVVRVSWDPPAQSGSSAVETYEISSGNSTWQVSGYETDWYAQRVPSGNQRFRVRAINYENRAGDWSPYSEYVSVPTNPNFPAATTPQPYYALWNTYHAKSSDSDEKSWSSGYRWDPCSGPVRIGMNPNGLVSEDTLTRWESKLRQWSAEISKASGLDVIYTGQTDLTPRPDDFWGAAGLHPSDSQYGFPDNHTGRMRRSPVDILIYWGPTDSYRWGETTRSNDWHRGRTVQETNDDMWLGKNRWFAAIRYDIHIRISETAGSYWTNLGASEKYLMHHLGMAFGLAPLSWAKNSPHLQVGNVPDGGLPDDFDTEMMVWGGRGSGAWKDDDPKWGPGDLIGFGLVGADNGCIQFWY